MKLEDFFSANRKVAIAFSGGVDSAYLLYAAVNLGVDAAAYYVKSQFQPEFEYKDAMRLADELKTTLKVIDIDVLGHECIVANTSKRCYECKKVIFKEIVDRAVADGYEIVLDGTNASDIEDDRPGMRAIRELNVQSPLRMCGLTKDEIRKLSKEAGLFTWDKPAYACLATRIKTDEKITTEVLCKVEKAENYLMNLGFSDMRVRVSGNEARLQLRAEEFDKYYADEAEINSEIGKLFDSVIFDSDNAR